MVKKNIGIIILLVSILLSIILITLKPEIEVESTVKKLPYEKTKKIISDRRRKATLSYDFIARASSLDSTCIHLFIDYRSMLLL